VSDLLTAAASALNVPEPLVERSAAARATANGTSVDDVLSAWAGGAPAGPSAPAPAAAEEQEAPAPEESLPPRRLRSQNRSPSPHPRSWFPPR
jgi:hypothetical protein